MSHFVKYVHVRNHLKEAAAEYIPQDVHQLQARAGDVALRPWSGGVDPLRDELVLVLELVSADEPEPRVFLVNLDGYWCLGFGRGGAGDGRRQIFSVRGGNGVPPSSAAATG